MKKTKKNKDKFLLLLALLGGLFLFSIIIQSKKNITSPSKNTHIVQATHSDEIKNKDNEKLYPRHIDGILVEQEKTNLPLVGVIIENHWDARPQAGLSKANLVIEAPVEGGITRFLAFFDNSVKIPKIGPIRSARPYFLDWVKGYNALLYHVGGSPQALQEIKSGYIDSLNQFFFDKYYWRSRERYAPHNVYTSSDLIEEAIQKKNRLHPKYKMWNYQDDKNNNGKSITEFSIDFSTPKFLVTYKYDKDQDVYLRYMAGKLHKDEDGNIIKVKNVVVIETDISIIDKVGRRKIRTIGKGKALLFIGGHMQSGIWQRENQNDIINFLNEDNKLIFFERGNTWLHVVDTLDKVNF